MKVFADARSTNIVWGYAPQRAMKWLGDAAWLPIGPGQTGCGAPEIVLRQDGEPPMSRSSPLDRVEERPMACRPLERRGPYEVAA